MNTTIHIQVYIQPNELKVIKKALETYKCGKKGRDICEDILGLIKYQEEKQRKEQ